MTQFVLVILAFSALMGSLFSLIVQQIVWSPGLLFATICLVCSVAITEVKRRKGPSTKLAKQYREVFEGKTAEKLASARGDDYVQKSERTLN